MNIPLGVIAVPPPYGTRPIVIAFIISCAFVLVIINMLHLVLSSKQRQRTSFRRELLGNVAVGALLLGLAAFFLYVDFNRGSPMSTAGMFVLFIALVVPVTMMKFNERRTRKKKK